MRVLPWSFLLGVTMAGAVAACSSGDDVDPDTASATSANNPAECPASYPSGGSCSPRGITCSYVEAGKTKRVQCLIEGPDSGTVQSARWWPLY